MSDEVAAPAEPAAADPTACPITAEFLPPNMKKHVDPKAPVPLRMMAAKALVPLSPSDMLSVLFMLTYDPDQGVRDQVAKTAATLQDRTAASGFRDEEVHPPVLGYFLRQYGQNDTYAEMLILNGNTPDDAVAAVAENCSKRTAETIGQNQLRLLRHDDILRALAKNPNAAGALIDGVCDFAVRSGHGPGRRAPDAGGAGAPVRASGARRAAPQRRAHGRRHHVGVLDARPPRAPRARRRWKRARSSRCRSASCR